MFEMVMLLGFVYAGFCCLWPQRKSLTPDRAQNEVANISRGAEDIKGKSVSQLVRCCRPVVMVFVRGILRKRRSGAIGCGPQGIYQPVGRGNL